MTERKASFAAVAALFVFGLAFVNVDRAAALPVFGGDFLGSYSIHDLGPVPGVPGPYGGLTTELGDDNTLLIGGEANFATGMLYSIGIIRGAGQHITGYSGIASVYAEAAWNDGGVAYAPNGVLFTVRWPVNELGQIKPGSAVTDKIIDLAALGIGGGGPGGGTFVPAGFAGQGQYKIVSWPDGIVYTLDLALDGAGTYDVVGVHQGPTIPGGPEGFIYVKAGSPGFAVDSILVSEFSANSIAAYEIDANGDPIVATRRDFITGLDGAEGAFFDKLTGDFMFSTFGAAEDRVYRIEGLQRVPEPSTLVLLGCGLALIARRTRRS